MSEDRAAARSLQEFQAFGESFKSESDRGAALVAASMLDDRLCSILRAFMIESKETDALLEGGPNAPLGTFSSRAAAALALGLIEPAEFRNVSIIRKIRNAFGHGWGQITFEDAPIRDLCRQLTSRQPRENLSSRGWFDAAVINLLGDWNPRPRLVREERRHAKEWPGKARYGRVVADENNTASSFKVEFLDEPKT